MDDRQFDRLTRAIGSGASRRTLLKGFIGAGGVVGLTELLTGSTDAARRGFSGPQLPTNPTPPPGPPSSGCPCGSDSLCINDACILRCSSIADCLGAANVDCLFVPATGNFCMNVNGTGSCSITPECGTGAACIGGACHAGLVIV